MEFIKQDRSWYLTFKTVDIRQNIYDHCIWIICISKHHIFPPIDHFVKFNTMDTRSLGVKLSLWADSVSAMSDQNLLVCREWWFLRGELNVLFLIRIHLHMNVYRNMHKTICTIECCPGFLRWFIMVCYSQSLRFHSYPDILYITTK